MGKRELLGSALRNRPDRVRAETVPSRERWTYGDWSSDVTVYVKSITNRGRTKVAGVMPGACCVRQVFERPQSGSVLQVGVRGSGAVSTARQSWPVRVLTGGAGHGPTRKQRRGFFSHR